MTPSLSIVVLTLDEEEHIRDCLTALAHQSNDTFEVIVVDAASTDRTVEIVEEMQDGFPVPLRLEAAESRLPVGEARNRGVELAQAPNVAFLSADTEAAAGWVGRALASLAEHDIVFGRQIHAPRERTVAAAARGLRYHFPSGPADDPAAYASNANAAVRADVLTRFPFGGSDEAGAVDDLLLTERAQAAGYDVDYDPDMVVAHRDVTTLDAEMNKNLREAAGWGAHAADLGLHRSLLVWGGLLVFSATVLLMLPSIVSFGLLAAVLWLPAGRRVLRRHDQMRARDLAAGFTLSPVFDLAFLAQYLRYLVFRPRQSPSGDDATEEMQA